VKQAVTQGAQLILAPNASPFEIDKHARRKAVLQQRILENRIPIVYANCVGGQDDLVFDGGSMVVDATGKICQHAGFFHEKLMLVDIEFTDTQTKISSSVSLPPPSLEEQIYQALVTGLRDYVQKNRFPGVLVGTSGGIDSALVLTIAVDALGSDKVTAVMMPSRYTSTMSAEDTMALAKALNVPYEIISIEPSFNSFQESLTEKFTGGESSMVRQNLQARCRGTLLMAISNSSGRIVLTTSNRSELAVGYATLYGDMAGAFAVLKDVPKTLVYRLANYRNNISAVIPQRTIERPPTAELASGQKDEDSLPPYPLLDTILELYLNQGKSADDIIAQGFEPTVVTQVIHLIHRSEYKRRQAPIGPRINQHAFGRGWRYPVTSKLS
jgi:NAD+ synthase (glutamine-hydrolysing)